MMPMMLLLVLLDGPPRIQLEDDGLTLDFPATWRLLPAGGPFTAMAERPPHDALAMFTRAELDADGAESNYLAGMPRAFRDHELLTSEHLTHPQLPVRRILLRGTTPGGTELRHLTYIFQGPNASFTLTFATKSDRYAELEPEFKTIADSLKLQDQHIPQEVAAFWQELAAGKPDLEQLARLLGSVDINARDRRGKTPLIFAILSRKGLLVRWLLAHGADPEHPNNDLKLMRLVASPPILALLEKHRSGAQPPAIAADATEPQHFTWASAEEELFSGIEEGRPARVADALGKEVDLNARDRNYRLPALEMTRQLIAEFRELELDPGNLPAIEHMLAKAKAARAATPPSP